MPKASVIFNITPMNEELDFIEPLISRAESYSKSNFELIKMKSLLKVSDVGSELLSRLLLAMFLLLFFITFSLGIGYLIGEYYGKISVGFFLLSGVYAFVGLLLFLLHKRIKSCLNNSIISQIFN